MSDNPEWSMTDVLGANGPVADCLSGFSPRLEQQHLGEAVHTALQHRATLIGEAGTGTGKTFAYLVPVLLSGQRVIISTGTRHLQDQLFHKDLPIIQQALAAPVQATLLKGRANYLCEHRLARARQIPELRERQHQRHLQILHEWSRSTETGDIAEVIGIPEDAMVWRYITSSDEFCSRHEPEELSGCYISRARKKAQEADVVVVNHHLLCADLALKEQGFGELLPTASAFIIDEAHQLPEVAASFFGRRLSSRQLFDLSRDVAMEQRMEAPDQQSLRDAAEALENAVRHFRLAFGIDAGRGAWVEVESESSVQREVEHLDAALQDLESELELADGRGKGLDACRNRCQAQRASFAAFTGPSTDTDYIHWYETFRTGFSLNMTPMSVAEPFQRAMQALPAAWVFTSATLAVGGDFSHFRASLGIEIADELQVDSPFDFKRNALLFLPAGLPEPASGQYVTEVVEAIKPVLSASRGRAFLLFTSYRAMHQAHELLEQWQRFPLLCQGQMPKQELLEAFQSLPNPVLLGTSSFWEGVDVRGEALSCVIIDKLPFASPSDPVLHARIDSMRSSGGNPFFEYQVPQAAISLKQGVGRLIRDTTDRGVLVLCDPRIRSKGYGQIFLDSLPPIPITSEIEEITQFFNAEASTRGLSDNREIPE